eukprot:GHVS01003179.1.p1 GENE.GHVS01003179.1~~GHVS01003179.1.p1  ORF type:complete len:1082 (-),score=111.75 GHVS01003179.1:101-3346(-)
MAKFRQRKLLAAIPSFLFMVLVFSLQPNLGETIGVKQFAQYLQSPAYDKVKIWQKFDLGWKFINSLTQMGQQVGVLLTKEILDTFGVDCDVMAVELKRNVYGDENDKIKFTLRVNRDHLPVVITRENLSTVNQPATTRHLPPTTATTPVGAMRPDRSLPATSAGSVPAPLAQRTPRRSGGDIGSTGPQAAAATPAQPFTTTNANPIGNRPELAFPVQPTDTAAAAASDQTSAIKLRAQALQGDEVFQRAVLSSARRFELKEVGQTRTALSAELNELFHSDRREDLFKISSFQIRRNDVKVKITGDGGLVAFAIFPRPGQQQTTNEADMETQSLPAAASAAAANAYPAQSAGGKRHATHVPQGSAAKAHRQDIHNQAHRQDIHSWSDRQQVPVTGSTAPLAQSFQQLNLLTLASQPNVGEVFDLQEQAGNLMRDGLLGDAVSNLWTAHRDEGDRYEEMTRGLNDFIQNFCGGHNRAQDVVHSRHTDNTETITFSLVGRGGSVPMSFPIDMSATTNEARVVAQPLPPDVPVTGRTPTAASPPQPNPWILAGQPNVPVTGRTPTAASPPQPNPWILAGQPNPRVVSRPTVFSTIYLLGCSVVSDLTPIVNAKVLLENSFGSLWGNSRDSAPSNADVTARINTALAQLRPPITASNVLCTREVNHDEQITVKIPFAKLVITRHTATTPNGNGMRGLPLYDFRGSSEDEDETVGDMDVDEDEPVGDTDEDEYDADRIQDEAGSYIFHEDENSEAVTDDDVDLNYLFTKLSGSSEASGICRAFVTMLNHAYAMRKTEQVELQAKANVALTEVSAKLTRRNVGVGDSIIRSSGLQMYLFFSENPRRIRKKADIDCSPYDMDENWLKVPIEQLYPVYLESTSLYKYSLMFLAQLGGTSLSIKKMTPWEHSNDKFCLTMSSSVEINNNIGTGVGQISWTGERTTSVDIARLKSGDGGGQLISSLVPIKTKITLHVHEEPRLRPDVMRAWLNFSADINAKVQTEWNRLPCVLESLKQIPNVRQEFNEATQFEDVTTHVMLESGSESTFSVVTTLFSGVFDTESGATQLDVVSLFCNDILDEMFVVKHQLFL